MKLIISHFKVVIVSVLLLLLLFYMQNGHATTSAYAITGIVTDSVTGKPIESAVVSLQKQKVGTLTDEEGEFRLINGRQTQATLRISAIGYRSKEIAISPGKYYRLNIKLISDGISMSEVTIKQTKEKYSKKNNPAVELIKKVIASKNKNTVDTQDYWKYSEYERVFFALNDFDPNKGILKSQKYLAKYIDTSRIDGHRILPYTMREYYRDVYKSKTPKETKKIVIGYNQQGIDKKMDNGNIASATDEIFKEINIRDDRISFFLIGFISPLSSSSSVDFYRWYIRDTVSIENKKYIQLSFLPFNTRDIGFSGDIFVSDDSTHAVKKVLLKISKKANINFVKTMLIEQTFDQLKSGLWAPSRFSTMVDFEYKKVGKIYVQKDQTFSNISTGTIYKEVFSSSEPEIKMKGFDSQDKDFWEQNRPHGIAKDLRLDSMYMDATKNKLMRFSLKVADFLQSGYYHTKWDPHFNKLDIGPAQTFYSTNSLEGTRLRLGALTTANLSRHLFLYGYGAYGTKDRVWKYNGEITWALFRREAIKDEFPKNNITLSYKYDINTLSQKYFQASYDNVTQLFKIQDVDNMTYKRTLQLDYVHEYQSGFSFTLFGRKSDESAGGNLKFEFIDKNSNITPLSSLKNTEVGVYLRYAHNEKFVQRKQKRILLDTESTVVSFDNTWGLNNTLGGQYSYHTMGIGIDKVKWIPPFGKLFASVRAEKVWGEVPFPLLLMPNANNSYAIQSRSFSLVTPMEFMNDRQLTWTIDYHMGGWLFNRIPLIKGLKLREILGFHGIWGDLNDKNKPTYNHNVLLFPSVTHAITSPYMEYNVGVDNILKFFRVDYVRRLNYLNRPNINKDGFRFGFSMKF